MIKIKAVIALLPNSGHVVLHVVLLTSFYCDVTTKQHLDGPFGYDVTMKKSVNRCDVGPLAKGQLIVNIELINNVTVKLTNYM